VPRTNQLPSRESDICQRLGKFRRETGLSRVAFARAVGLDSSALVRYEHCRAMVPYEAAYKIWKKFNVSVKWLVTGAGKTLDLSPLPDPQSVPRNPTARLSAAFDYWLTKGASRFDPFYGMNVPKKNERWLVSRELIKEAEEWLSMVPDDELSAFIEALQSRADELINSYGYQSAAVVWERRLEVERAAADVTNGSSSGEGSSVVKDSQKEVLRGVTQYSKSGGVNLNMALLIKRLRQLTAPVGMKGRLAKALGVPRPRVSEWLSGKTAPGGETTLKMLHWVEDQERQQNTPGSVTSTAKGKTQIGKSSYEKPTQVLKKQ
jgi:transcriptional regulator with XRE-family HTH domain